MTCFEAPKLIFTYSDGNPGLISVFGVIMLDFKTYGDKSLGSVLISVLISLLTTLGDRLLDRVIIGFGGS